MDYFQLVYPRKAPTKYIFYPRKVKCRSNKNISVSSPLVQFRGRWCIQIGGSSVPPGGEISIKGGNFWPHSQIKYDDNAAAENKTVILLGILKPLIDLQMVSRDGGIGF